MKRTLLLLPFVLIACGPPYGRRVPDHLVAKLPYETRVELLEAENALALAIDRVDTARSDIDRNRDGIRRARARLDAAHQEVGRAQNPTDREVAELARAEAEARVEALRAGQELAVQQTEIEELSLRCAWAAYEEARLEAARKTKVEGSESLKPEDFQGQTKACEAEVAERRKRLQEPEKRLAEVRGRWEQTKQALAKRTFDARASPFVE